MLEEINEKIQVLALFQDQKLKPFKFMWNNREIRIQKINLNYTTWEGRSKIYYFAVSDGSNYYKLRFDADQLTWTLIETYVD